MKSADNRGENRLVVLALTPEITSINITFLARLAAICELRILMDTRDIIRALPSEYIERCALLESTALYRRLIKKNGCDPFRAFFFGTSATHLQGACDAGAQTMKLRTDLIGTVDFNEDAFCSAYYGNGSRTEPTTTVRAIIRDFVGPYAPLDRYGISEAPLASMRPQ